MIHRKIYDHINRCRKITLQNPTHILKKKNLSVHQEQIYMVEKIVIIMGASEDVGKQTLGYDGYVHYLDHNDVSQVHTYVKIY